MLMPIAQMYSVPARTMSNGTGNTPLENWFAFVTLAGLSLLGILFYGVVTAALWNLSKNMPGFRFLFSAAIADLLAMVQFGIWPGLLAVLEFDPLPESSRPAVQFYIDSVWFVLCWQYPLVAISRYVAIKWPFWFRNLSTKKCAAVCALSYVLGIAETTVLHSMPFHVLFYYDAQSFGTVSADFVKYATQGQADFFLFTHIITIGISCVIYLVTVWELVRMKKSRVSNDHNANKRDAQGGDGGKQQKAPDLAAEKRLVVSCVTNTFVFVLGQVLITVGVASGKWIVWSIMFVFVWNSLLSAIFLVATSTIVRNKTLVYMRLKAPEAPLATSATTRL